MAKRSPNLFAPLWLLHLPASLVLGCGCHVTMFFYLNVSWYDVCPSQACP